jgi:hypothetical protein
MEKTFKYSNLEAITYTLNMYSIYDLLKRAGEVPDGFEFDYENTDKTDNFRVTARRITDAKP